MKKKQRTNVLDDLAQAQKSKKRGRRMAVIFGLLFLVSVPDLFQNEASDSADIGMTIFCGLLTAWGVWKIYSGERIERLQRRFRLFAGYFQHDPQKSVSGLCAALRLDRAAVQRELTEMCARGYFDGYLDYQRDCLVFIHAPTGQPTDGVVQCPGCGAPNHVQQVGQHCRYCDAPLNLTN